MLHIFLVSLALLALLSIIFEELTHINKAKTTLFLGCIAWVSLFIAADSHEQPLVQQRLAENLLEIATLWLFLMSTMTFVAYLNAKGMIQIVISKLFPHTLSIRTLMLLVALFALAISSICDNVTATLVTLGLLSTFQLDSPLRQRMAVLIVFAVNSGGVSLITGDVTTLMIFLAGHVQMADLLLLLLPTICSASLLALLLSRQQQGSVTAGITPTQYERVDLYISLIFISTIILTMVLNVLFSIPPVLTFLTGLSLMFLVGRTSHSDNEEIRILEYVRQVEYETLLFFLGILLLVGMLKEIGVLTLVANTYAAHDPDIANFVTGIFSALIDNVPLTAALLKASPELPLSGWLGLTYAVGVGGSLLVVGSAAGIVAMSKVKELTFVSYLRYFPALFLCYCCGYGMTLLVGHYLIQ